MFFFLLGKCLQRSKSNAQPRTVDLQKILGHTSLDMTQRYAHLAPEHLVQAANVVNFGAKTEPRSFKFV